MTMSAEAIPRCSVSADCPMTMGYYIGGGQYVCWLHALTVSGIAKAVEGQEEVTLRGTHR